MTYQPPHPYHPPNHNIHPPTQPPKRNGKRTKLVAGIIGAAMALCCGGVAVAAITGDTTNTPTPPAAQEQPSTTPTTAETTPTTEAPAAVDATTTPPKPVKPVKLSFRRLTERQWLKIAKNPDAHIGETIVVYGSVTQFDSATGRDTFRADIGASNKEYEFDYPTNTILSGSTRLLDDLVEGDEFRANVIVAGSFSYETQIGGETTVPTLSVQSVKVL